VCRKDSNKAQVVITIHFTVFKRSVIAVASYLTIFSEYRTVFSIRFHTAFTESLVKIVPVFNFMDWAWQMVGVALQKVCTYP
jgi:hypothetical protein